MPKTYNTTAAFFEENGSDAHLPPENMAALLLGGDPPPVEAADPEPTPAEPEQPAGEEVVAESVEPEPTPAEPEQPAEPEKVILAKDGKHIIEYEKLEEAREKAKRFKTELDDSIGRIKTLEETIATLTAPKEDPVDAEAARVQAEEAAEAIEDLKENDPEVYKAVEVMLNTQLKALEDKFNEMVTPVKEATELSDLERHFNTIAESHEDYETLINSGKVDEWIATQPEVLQDALTAAIDSGTAKQVIGVLDMYKGDNPAAAEPEDADATAAKEVAATAAKAVAAAKEKVTVPNSLSEVPAGSNAHHDPMEALTQKSPKQIIDAFSGKSSSDILEGMSKLL